MKTKVSVPHKPNPAMPKFPEKVFRAMFRSAVRKPAKRDGNAQVGLWKRG